ncbi:flagellar filament capping protein FliD [Clostridium beijerinckii]|uniref:flagellar filament capping protein FliD n=1 Tax=Clostridium beijerinckii TaxID=1520 RepID=UPI00232EF11A|nr:flagellar filament capping protein FliD [Clostridium beijerinckii]
MSTIQRITGTNSGLDVDALVKSAMQGYQTKIDREVQNKKVMEYQQEQYKKIMSDASDFYDKYFDILKSGNFMSASSYQTLTFTSTDGAKVTAKGLAGANIDNYTVNVTQLASKASDSLSVSMTGNQTIKIGTAEISFQAVSDGNTTISNYNAAIAAKKKELNDAVTAGSATAEQKTQLAYLNNNTITAKYSEFTKSITFTAAAFGGSGFTLNSNPKAEDKYLEATIKNSSGVVYTINSIDKKTSNSVTIDNVQFDFKSIGTSTSATPTASLNDVGALNSTDLAIGGDVAPLTELTALDEDATTTRPSTTDGSKKTITTSGTKTTIRVTTASGDTTTTTTDTSKPGIVSVVDKDGIITTTDTNQLTNNSGYTLKTVKVGDTTTTSKINYDGTIPITKQIETSGTTTTATTTLKSGSTTTVNKEIKDSGVVTSTTSTTKKETSDGTITTVIAADGKKTTTQMQVGADGKTTKTVTTSSALNLTPGDSGTTTNTTTDGTTTTTTITKVGADGSLTKTVTIDDGVTQSTTTTVTTSTAYNSPTSLSGSTDVSGLKDKIVKFVDDYNTLLSSINTKIFETRDKDYMPLTDAQKDAMTESQVTAWEKKAQTGLLRKDSDLERIASEMKSAMSTVTSGSGLSLEKIGISPVKNYADKNGMLTVDEDKLTKALEESGGDVRDLFTRAASDTDSGGALTKLRSALYSEFKKSTSLLSKKAGLSGTSTESDNTLTKNIYKKKLLIADMNKSFTDRENALYKKYSDLETVMQRLNSQQSSLASMLGK